MVTSIADRRGVLILAHRGLPGAGRTENTAEAVTAAFDCGADGVEVDLRLTADGVLAVCHDPDLHRIAGERTPVAGVEWPALRDTAGQHGVRLARLEDVLTVAAGRRIVLEVKKPPPSPAAEARTALAVAGKLRSLQRQGLSLDVTVSSFSPTLVGHVRRLLSPGTGVRTALLGRPLDGAASVLRQALDAGHDEMHPHLLAVLAAPHSVAAAHALGLAVVPWTANRRRELRRLERLGVDAVITDVPALARAAVTGTPAAV